MRIRKLGMITAAALLLTGLTGCMTREVVRNPKEATTTLIVAVSGSRAELSWLSQTDMSYTVLWADRSAQTPNWQPVPNCVDLPGTGGQMLYTDTIPDGAERVYRLQHVLLNPQH